MIHFMAYRKIPITRLELIFVQKAALFSGELIFRGAYYWKEFCISKSVGFDNKTASTNSPWGSLRFGGLVFGMAYLFIY